MKKVDKKLIIDDLSLARRGAPWLKTVEVQNKLQKSKFVKLKQDRFCREFFFRQIDTAGDKNKGKRHFFSVKSRQDKLANYCG